MNETLLDDFFDLLKLIKQKAYPDVLFRGHRSGHHLSINIPKIPSQFCRLRIPSGSCLHLETVEVLAISGASIISASANAELSVSSVLPGTEQALNARKLLNPNHRGLGVHTDNKGDEWICLKFQDVLPIVKIVVHNRDDEWAVRAWGLIIELSVDGEAWAEVYNHLLRMQEFLQCVFSATKHMNTPIDEQYLVQACLDILQFLLLQDYPSANARLANLKKLPPALTTKIRNRFSEEVLSLYLKEWNGHGITRPFRYWSEKQKSLYLNRSMELCNDLKGLSENVCLGFGFVLAYIREGTLIPHDDDIDLLISFDAVTCPSITKALELVENYLRELDYTVTGNHPSHRWVTKPGCGAIDVFVGLKEDEDVSWYPSSRRNLKMTDVFPPITVDLHGVSCPIPRNPIKYIEKTYGCDWRCPDINFKHPWDKSQFSDIA